MGAPLTTDADYLRRLVDDKSEDYIDDDVTLTTAHQRYVAEVPAGAEDDNEITLPPALLWPCEDILIRAQDLTGQAAGHVTILAPTDCLPNFSDISLVADEWAFIHNANGIAMYAITQINHG